MATPLNTIKNWFRTGLFPTQAQFWSTWDSFWHKDESIPQESVNGLQGALNEKVDTEALHAVATSGNYEDLTNRPLTTASRTIYKLPGNVEAYPEVGDRVKGFIAGKFIEDAACIVDNGDPDDLDTWNVTQADDLNDID